MFGPDDRETADVSQFPFAAVGRLDSGCTGTLIGRRLVLTAAHCIIDSQTGAVQASVKYFRPALTGGRSLAPAWIDYAWLGGEKPEQDRLTDWAVLRLERELGERFAQLGVHEVDFASALPYTTNLIGYSIDRERGDVPSLHRNCYVHEVRDGRLFHDCDAAPGVSGGPLITPIGGVPHVVGITVSEYRQGSPSSVRRDAYSSEYANVAIPATLFAQAVRTLVQTADVGVAAPQIPGVIERTNPNPRTPADEPGGGGAGRGGYAARDVISYPALIAAYPQVAAATGELDRAVLSVGELAQANGASGLQEDARRMRRGCQDFGQVMLQISRRVPMGNAPQRVFDQYQSLLAHREALTAFDWWRDKPDVQRTFDAQILALDAVLRRLEGLIFDAE